MTDTSSLVALAGSQSPEQNFLTRGEVVALYHCFRDNHDMHARKYLVHAFRRHAIVIALKHVQYGIRLSALISEGELGVAHALAEYDTDRNCHLVTYVAYWIRASIVTGVISRLSSAGADVEEPTRLLLRKLHRDKARLANLLGERCDIAEPFQTALMNASRTSSNIRLQTPDSWGRSARDEAMRAGLAAMGAPRG